MRTFCKPTAGKQGIKSEVRFLKQWVRRRGSLYVLPDFIASGKSATEIGVFTRQRASNKRARRLPCVERLRSESWSVRATCLLYFVSCVTILFHRLFSHLLDQFIPHVLGWPKVSSQLKQVRICLLRPRHNSHPPSSGDHHRHDHLLITRAMFP